MLDRAGCSACCRCTPRATTGSSRSTAPGSARSWTGSYSDPGDPSPSRLLLHDTAEPLTVASLVPVHLGQARLAYLSACQTATNLATSLLDEAIHLSGAFQIAGFPQVIGTLWEIDDKGAVRIADGFYARLDNEAAGLDTSRAAHALHGVLCKERDNFFRTPSLWAAYMHAGA